MMKALRTIYLPVLVAVILLVGGVSAARAESIDPFIGEYHGAAIDYGQDELKARDLDVSIKQNAKGFSIDWSTVIYKDDGREKLAKLSIDFYESDRPGIYGSAMRTGLFGKRVPNDPMQGEPFVWARIVNGTLTVHALYITENGGYEMQVYDRTLDQDGNIDLVFERFRDGEAIRAIKGKLERQ
ncbi:hypothetical protein [Thalassospira sp.]|uniref:hypothetical protein n=1 Tax=Thalassospira sp. TaxID=1912094 RepID=UPI0027339EB7|nr:hypothetical protein [Thalassospira sp.]MDP2697954.1 hypothetical protein [Thalassospira sp.]